MIIIKLFQTLTLDITIKAKLADERMVCSTILSDRSVQRIKVKYSRESLWFTQSVISPGPIIPPSLTSEPFGPARYNRLSTRFVHKRVIKG